MLAVPTIRPFLLALAAVMALPQTVAAYAQADAAGVGDPFVAYVQSVRARALAAGVRPATFDSIAPTLYVDSRVIRLDRAQPGSTTQAIPPFAPYRARHVDAARINGGRQRHAQLRPLLARIEAETGVPEAVMMSIYGHETGYGANSGNFDLLNALATLAYEGRRRALFEAELIAAMKMIDQGVPRTTLKGSWAGATGYPQFLPSVYLRLARDGDGDGKADIWRSEADALASIGNYLANAGWKRGVPWGVAVRVPAGFSRADIASGLTSPRCPRVHQRHSRWLTIAEWRARGIVLPARGVPADSELASLLEPDGPDATAYLLTHNYRAILDYNCSNFYALSVGLLADAIVQ